MFTIGIITLFPKMFYSVINYGVIGKAIKNNILNIKFWNLRDYSEKKYKSVDSTLYGGGKGMLMMCNPIYNAIIHAKKIIGHNSYVIYLSPKGKLINNLDIIRFLKKESLIIICGRYEGIDERLLYININEEISIGDYVLSGGEIPAMVVIDIISRYIPGVLNSYESLKNDSFFNGLLDYPNYTKPKIFMNFKVPDILLSGNHKKIFEWRLKQSLGET